ncbi:MAG: hypothetical protein ABI602_03570 [Candidatus Saccharibacteria bacterium]
MNMFIAVASSQANRLFHNHSSRLVVSAAVILFGVTLLWPQPALAMKASDLYGIAPVSLANLIADHCNNDGWHVVQDEWISPAGAPTATSTTVAYGAASVSLQLNWITYRCKSATKSTTSGSFKIDDTNPNIKDLIGVVGDLPYVGTGSTGAKSGVVKKFDYNGPFTAKTTINLDLITRGTITKKQGKTTSYICAAVAPGEPEVATSGPHKFDPKPGYCKQDTTTFSILVNVKAKIIVIPPSLCPNLPGVDYAKVGVSLPSGEPGTSPTSPPKKGNTYITRVVTGHTINSAVDANTGKALPFDNATFTVNFTSSVKAYPYDAQTATLTYYNSYIKTIYTYNGTAWVATASSAFAKSSLHSDGQASMGECYRRGFTVTSVSPGNVTLLPSREDPTQASAGGASATVAFDYNGGPTPTGGMRTPMSIQLNYSWQFDNGCSGSGSFTVTGGYGAGNATGFIPASPSCPASAPPLAAGDVVCITYTVDPATGEMTSNGIPIGGSGSVDSGQACSQAVTNMPYAHFFGLDVSAGGNFATGSDKCLGSTPAPSGIVAFVKGIGPLVRGSAVQYGALALGPVNSFGSASLRPAIPTSRDGLTFANQGPLGSLGTTHCVPDYFSTIPATLTQSSSDVNMAPFDGVGVPATPQQFWYGRAGRTTIKGFPGAGQGINKGNRIAIYVSGDVFIKDDIKFKQTSWTTSDVVPSFYLIVKGNIFISPNVSQLDGVYVAQNGTINTCAPSVGVYLPSEVYDNCTNQLTVNGAFVAKNVNLYRTFASLRNSQGGESPLGPLGPDNCTINGARSTTYDCAAEIFNFSPETFLSKPALGRSANVGGIKYDFITSLSPVL